MQILENLLKLKQPCKINVELPQLREYYNFRVGRMSAAIWPCSFMLSKLSDVTKTLHVETEAKTEAAGFETESEAKTVASETRPRPRQYTSRQRPRPRQ